MRHFTKCVFALQNPEIWSIPADQNGSSWLFSLMCMHSWNSRPLNDSLKTVNQDVQDVVQFDTFPLPRRKVLMKWCWQTRVKLSWPFIKRYMLLKLMQSNSTALQKKSYLYLGCYIIRQLKLRQGQIHLIKFMYQKTGKAKRKWFKHVLIQR